MCSSILWPRLIVLAGCLSRVKQWLINCLWFPRSVTSGFRQGPVPRPVHTLARNIGRSARRTPISNSLSEASCSVGDLGLTPSVRNFRKHIFCWVAGLLGSGFSVFCLSLICSTHRALKYSKYFGWFFYGWISSENAGCASSLYP
ncbi:hypothetical protein B0H14DRAFT_3012892, partial [Mycena olivaceomarginata]